MGLSIIDLFFVSFMNLIDLFRDEIMLIDDLN